MLLPSPMLTSTPEVHLSKDHVWVHGSNTGGVCAEVQAPYYHQMSHRTPVLETQSEALGIWGSVLLPEQSQSKGPGLLPVVPRAQTPKHHQETRSDLKKKKQRDFLLLLLLFQHAGADKGKVAAVPEGDGASFKPY